MDLDAIIRWIGRAAAAGIMLVFYFFGKKTRRDEDDLEALKAANSQLTQQMIDDGKLQKKYEDLKNRAPIDWSGDGGVQLNARKVPKKPTSSRASSSN